MMGHSTVQPSHHVSSWSPDGVTIPRRFNAYGSIQFLHTPKTEIGSATDFWISLSSWWDFNNTVRTVASTALLHIKFYYCTIRILHYTVNKSGKWCFFGWICQLLSISKNSDSRNSLLFKSCSHRFETHHSQLAQPADLSCWLMFTLYHFCHRGALPTLPFQNFYEPTSVTSQYYIEWIRFFSAQPIPVGTSFCQRLFMVLSLQNYDDYCAYCAK